MARRVDLAVGLRARHDGDVVDGAGLLEGGHLDLVRGAVCELATPGKVKRMPVGLPTSRQE